MAGCHGPADNLAKLDVPNPALPSGWVQFRDEPGGFALQTPEGWSTSAEFEASALANRGNLLGGALLLVDGAAIRANDLVTFSIMRFRDPNREELEVNDLNALATKARAAMDKNMTDVKNERIQLPIGPAEHVWGVLSKTFPDGVTRRITSHMVVFASALRIYTVAYGYPTEKESQYRPTADAILRTVRLILPDKEGKVTMPASARAGVPMPFLHPSAPTTPPPGFSPPAQSQPSNPWPSQPSQPESAPGPSTPGPSTPGPTEPAPPPTADPGGPPPVDPGNGSGEALPPSGP